MKNVETAGVNVSVTSYDAVSENEERRGGSKKEEERRSGEVI